MVKTVEIGDKTFYIHKMDAFTGLKAFGDLQKDILPALGGVIGGGNGGGADNAGISEAIAALSGSLSGDALAHWSNRLLCDGNVSFDAPSGDAIALKKTDFDTVFSDFTGILELLVAVILENFKDPLVQLLNRTGLDTLSKEKISALTAQS